MTSPPGALLVCFALSATSCGSSPPPLRDSADGEATELVLADRGYWVEQPRAGEIGVDWPPAQTALEVELDPSLGGEARVELRIDDVMLWDGVYSEPLHVALPAGTHDVAVVVVSRGTAGRATARIESRRGCRLRLRASGPGRFRLDEHMDCGIAAAR